MVYRSASISTPITCAIYTIFLHHVSVDVCFAAWKKHLLLLAERGTLLYWKIKYLFFRFTFYSIRRCLSFYLAATQGFKEFLMLSLLM